LGYLREGGAFAHPRHVDLLIEARDVLGDGALQQAVVLGDEGDLFIGGERDNPVQLLRVVVPASLGIYPEISGSHYRSSVRFVLWQGPEERPRQAQQDIPFEMICCG
jgi:hypothetical protein